MFVFVYLVSMARELVLNSSLVVDQISRHNCVEENKELNNDVIFEATLKRWESTICKSRYKCVGSL